MKDEFVFDCRYVDSFPGQLVRWMDFLRETGIDERDRPDVKLKAGNSWLYRGMAWIPLEMLDDPKALVEGDRDRIWSRVAKDRARDAERIYEQMMSSGRKKEARALRDRSLQCAPGFYDSIGRGGCAPWTINPARASISFADPDYLKPRVRDCAVNVLCVARCSKCACKYGGDPESHPINEAEFRSDVRLADVEAIFVLSFMPLRLKRAGAAERKTFALSEYLECRIKPPTAWESVLTLSGIMRAPRTFIVPLQLSGRGSLPDLPAQARVVTRKDEIDRVGADFDWYRLL